METIKNYFNSFSRRVVYTIIIILIGIGIGWYYTNNVDYDDSTTVRDENQSKYGVNIIFDYDKMIFRLTNFGIDFITCCK